MGECMTFGNDLHPSWGVGPIQIYIGYLDDNLRERAPIYSVQLKETQTVLCETSTFAHVKQEVDYFLSCMEDIHQEFTKYHDKVETHLDYLRAKQTVENYERKEK